MPDQAALAIQETEKYSVREFAPGTYGGIVGDGFGLWYPQRSELIQAWGSQGCDWMLRMFHYMPHNTLWSGAHDIYVQKVLSTPFEISGGRNITYKWQEVFFESDFGEGYDFMMSKALTDYLTLNRGMFLEKIAYGDPSKPLKEGTRILGLAHLDAMRIVYTGNREFPYIYYSEETNTAHKLHYTRVINLAHSPSPNTRMFGMGKSPLYSALSTVNRQILLGRHQTELLNDLPPPGLIVFTNVKGENIEQAMRAFELERKGDGQSLYRAPLRIEGVDPKNPVTVSFTPLASVPSDFDYQKYITTDVNILALNMQLDPQDLWPLSGQALGTGTQSKILSGKTQVKGPGYLLTRLERTWNTVTPRGMEFKYKAQNAEQDLETAAVAEKWVAIIRDATFMDEVEKRQMAANQIPAFADVLLDEAGNVRLPDDDPKEETQEVLVDDAIVADVAEQPAPDGTTVPPGTEDTTADDTEQITKEYEATKNAFTSELESIFGDAATGGISKTSFKARLRSAISKYGKAAYTDGLEVGGVDAGAFDETDSSNFADLLAGEAQYVTNVANEIYATETGLKGSPEFKASIWQVTLNKFYYGGTESADRNGMYTFVGEDGEESCKDCKELKNKTHRMKWWVDNRKRPGVDIESFECKAFKCQHFLEKKLSKMLRGLTFSLS